MQLGERTRLYPESIPRLGFPRSTPLEKALLLIIVIALIAVVALSIALVSAYNRKEDKWKNQSPADYCNTTACVSTAAEILQSLDRTIEPCEDFYQFVCGNWMKSSHLFEDTDTQFVRLKKKVLENVRELLEQHQRSRRAEHEKKPIGFYSACMNKVRRNEDGVTDLLQDIKSLGGWPLLDGTWKSEAFDWIQLMADAAKRGHLNNMLIDVSVIPGIKNVSTNLIAIGAPSLVMSNKVFYELQDNCDAQQNMTLNIAKVLRPDLDEEKALDEIKRAFSIEKRLAKADVTSETNVMEKNSFRIMTVKQLRDAAPNIDWKVLFKKMLKGSPNVEDDERIFVKDPSSVKALNSVLDQRSSQEKRALSNYMFYRIVLDAAQHLSTNVVRLLEAASSKFESATQWETCLKLTTRYFHPSITYTYVETYVDAAKMKMMETLYGDTVAAFTSRLRNTIWLDYITKKNAVTKIRSLKAALAYHKDLNHEKLNAIYNEVTVGRSHYQNVKQMQYWETMGKVSGYRERNERFSWASTGNMLSSIAYYEPTENAIIIPVGMTEDFFLSTERPNYMNYGTFSTILAHEIAHGYDNKGGLYDAQGNKNVWWTNDSWKVFEEKAKCFVDQYNEYYQPTTHNHVNGSATLSENIADTEGVLAAYQAYMSAVGNSFDKALPGLQYNNKQMFWIAYASVWCRKQTDDSFNYSLKSSVHAPARFRIRGVLSNLKEFSRDFQCKDTSTMNPENKCLIWDDKNQINKR